MRGETSPEEREICVLVKQLVDNVQMSQTKHLMEQKQFFDIQRQAVERLNENDRKGTKLYAELERWANQLSSILRMHEEIQTRNADMQESNYADYTANMQAHRENMIMHRLNMKMHRTNLRNYHRNRVQHRKNMQQQRRNLAQLNRIALENAKTADRQLDREFDRAFAGGEREPRTDECDGSGSSGGNELRRQSPSLYS